MLNPTNTIVLPIRPIQTTLPGDFTHVTTDKYSTLFDGVNEYVSGQGTKGSAATLPGYTIAYWAKAASQTSKTILSDWNEVQPTGRNWKLSIGGTASNAVLHIDMTNSGATTTRKSYETVTSVFNSTWRHVAVVFTSNVVNVYLDTVAQTLTVNVSATFTAIYDHVAGNSNFYMGAYLNGVGAATNFAAMNLDQVGVWKTALAQSQICGIYDGKGIINLKNSPDATNVMRFFRMGDGDTYPSIFDNVNGVAAIMNNMEATDFVLDLSARLLCLLGLAFNCTSRNL